MLTAKCPTGTASRAGPAQPVHEIPQRRPDRGTDRDQQDTSPGRLPAAADVADHLDRIHDHQPLVNQLVELR